MRLVSVLALASMVALMWTGRAGAAPIVAANPAAVVSLALDSATSTITFSITPDAQGVKGFALFFDVSDAASIIVQGCSSPVDPAPVCPVGGTSFNFAVLDFTPAKGATFVAGSVDLQIPAVSSLGATLTLASRSTITEGDFNEVILSETLVAQVVPEPTTAMLLGLGLVSLGLRRRGR